MRYVEKQIELTELKYPLQTFVINLNMDAAFPSPPETRARSRSKTPFTKSAEENGKDGRKSPDLK